MAGALARPADRPALVEAIGRCRDPAARSLLAWALLRLSPQGSRDLAEKLDAAARQAGAGEDPLLRATAARLRARAGGS